MHFAMSITLCESRHVGDTHAELFTRYPLDPSLFSSSLPISLLSLLCSSPVAFPFSYNDSLFLQTACSSFNASLY